MLFQIILLAFLQQFQSVVFGHSWVECSQYTGVIYGQDYNSSNCKGYIRNWASYSSTSFGSDRGANYQPGGRTASGNWCSKTIGSPLTSSYTSAFPMANYSVGDTIRVVWPAKNHGNDADLTASCNNNNLKDFQMKLYMNPTVNPTSDPQTLSDWKLVFDWHAGVDHDFSVNGLGGTPFQQCPKYCTNTNLAVCYGDLTINSSLISTSGYYTFMWYWAFNSEDDVYTNCYEAYVSKTSYNSGFIDGGESNANQSISSYRITINICIYATTYPSKSSIELLILSLTGADDVVGKSVTSISGGYSMQFIIKTSASGVAAVTSALNNGVVTTAIEDEYLNSGESAAICDDVSTEALYSASNYIHGLFSIILSIIITFYFY